LTDLARERDAALAKLSNERTGIAVSADEVLEVDRLLRDRWRIDLVQTNHGLEEYLRSVPLSAAVALGLKAFDSKATAQRKMSGERFMYEAMADPELCGLVTSSRRHVLIDTICLACALFRALRMSGPILDVGCHIGIAPSIISRVFGIPTTGIDPVRSAIETGISLLKDHPHVQLIHAAVPWVTNSRFDMVTAIDSLPDEAPAQASFLKGLGALLNDGGVAIITSQHWPFVDVPTLRRQLGLAGLGFGLGDIAGGFGGMPTEFGVESVVCLIKGGKQQFPRDIKRVGSTDWDVFRDYANAADTPAREKTQAFMRARR